MLPCGDKSTARAQRIASRWVRLPNAQACSNAVQRLFFGDFLLAPQKKVTRLQGRIPGTILATRPQPQAA
jgi:hypothetical protein